LDSPPRTLAATSASPLEGKSTTLANLAVVLAQAGQRVILVDADLRRPRVHKIFNVPNQIGLSSALLRSETTVDGCLHETQQPNLSVLTSGPLPPDPSELLGSQRFAAFVVALKERADIVLFDCPPVLGLTDAALLARQVDGVLLVVNAGTTRRQWALAAAESLQQVNARILGVILNRYRDKRNDYYSYRYSSGEESRQGWRAKVKRK
jgi:capsular exopolysaccharide synthesis family protein